MSWQSYRTAEIFTLLGEYCLDLPTLRLTWIRSPSPRLSITSSSTLPMLQHSRARQSSLLEQSLPSIQLWNGSRMKSASIGFWEWKWDSKRTSLQIRGQTHNKENYYLCLTFPLQVYWLLPLQYAVKYFLSHYVYKIEDDCLLHSLFHWLVCLCFELLLLLHGHFQQLPQSKFLLLLLLRCWTEVKADDRRTPIAISSFPHLH